MTISKESNINYMTCTTCNTVVQVNNIGICINCQLGFVGVYTSIKKPEIDNCGIIPQKEEDQLKRLQEKNDG